MHGSPPGAPHRPMLLPDTLLPSQFFAILRGPNPPRPPEHRLLIAVLEDAIRCFQKYSGTTSQCEHQLFREAEAWIMGDNEPRDQRLNAQGLAFSFRYVCDTLGVDPDYLRRGLRHWRSMQPGKKGCRPAAQCEGRKGDTSKREAGVLRRTSPRG